jgi:hypothetical protein
VTDYVTMLRNTYVHEAQGDAFFKALIDRQPDEERREKLRTLHTIEARTITTMNRLLEKAGIRVDTAGARKHGRVLAAEVDPSDWSGFLRGLHETIPHDIERYSELRDASPTPSDPALAALVNHARAIEQFVDLEVRGEQKKSMRALTNYLRKPV